MWNSITTLKWYCKAILNVFFNLKKIDDEKKITYMIICCVKSELCYLTCKYCLKFEVFPKFIKFQVCFCLNCQIPGFSRWSGNPAYIKSLKFQVDYWFLFEILGFSKNSQIPGLSMISGFLATLERAFQKIDPWLTTGCLPLLY